MVVDGAFVDATSIADPSTGGAAGGMASTDRDLLRFVRALADGTLLTPASLAAMRSFVPGEDYSQFGIDHGYGLGWERYALDTITVEGHMGTGEAQSAFIGYDVERGTAVAVMTNTAVAGPQAIMGVEALLAAGPGSPLNRLVVRRQEDLRIMLATDDRRGGLRYRRSVHWRERLTARLRSFDPAVVDVVVAAVFTVGAIASVLGQDIHDASGALRNGYREPGPLIIVTALVTCAPIAVRRRWPLAALVVSCLGIITHFLADFPEGSLPLAALLLTYTVGAWCPLRRAVAGLGVVAATLVVLWVSDSPGLDTVGTIGVVAQYAAAWALGVAMRNRRVAADALVRQADERAEAERQAAARVVAEERLRIAQELHDIVGHSMSVIAVQAGVGVHVLDAHPEQARTVLETISATSRGTLTEMRRLLGVLRDDDGERSNAPAPGLGDVPALVADVRAAGVPVTLHVDGTRRRDPGRRRALRLPRRPGSADERDQARRRADAAST